MTSVPTPIDVIESLVVSIGYPALGWALWVWLAFTAVKSWVSFVETSARNATGIITGASELIRDWTTERMRSAIGLILAGGAFITVAYALGQLGAVTYASFDGGPSIADGRHFDWSFLEQHLLGYHEWSGPAVDTVVVAFVLIAIQSIAHLLGRNGLLNICLYAFGTVHVLSLIAAVMIGVAGLCVLGLGLTGSPNYTPQMAILYGIWVGLLVLLPVLGWCLPMASLGLFEPPNQRR